MSETKTVLDIGSNMGLVSIHLADFVKKVIGIEINPYVVNIGNSIKEELKVENVEFIKTRFEDYKTDEKFDIVLSLANDHTIDKNTEFTIFEYLEKISVAAVSHQIYLFSISHAFPRTKQHLPFLSTLVLVDHSLRLGLPGF